MGQFDKTNLVLKGNYKALFTFYGITDTDGNANQLDDICRLWLKNFMVVAR